MIGSKDIQSGKNANQIYENALSKTKCLKEGISGRDVIPQERKLQIHGDMLTKE